MRAQMDALQKQNAATAASVEAMKQTLAARDDGNRTAAAEFNRQIQAIRDDIRAVGSRIDELQHRLSGLSDAAPGGAPRIPSSPSAAPPAAGGSDTAAADRTGDDLDPSAGGNRAGGAATGPAGSPSGSGSAGSGGAAAEDLFKMALCGRLGFQDYLAKYPRSDKADDALYWIGLCHYDQGPLSRRICWPSSTLVPASRTTIGTGTCASRARLDDSLRHPVAAVDAGKDVDQHDATFGSESTSRNAAATRSGEAPPPTSRKLAGSPPACLIMSIVAMARPAPLTMQPIVAVQLDVVESMLRRFRIARIFLGVVAQLAHVGPAKQHVVVERHLGVERQHLAASW